MSWRIVAWAKAPALLAIVLAAVAVDAQVQGRWVRLAPIPEANEEWDSAVLNGKLYLVGGNPVAVGAKQGAPPGLVFEYDPAADRWTKKKTMPQPAHHSALVGYNNKIYAFGGAVQRQPGGSTQFPIENAWEYDPAADTWRALAPMPIRRMAAAAVESGGKIYVIGGAGPWRGLENEPLGGEGPALTGPLFTANWDGVALNDLVERIRQTMPADNPGILSREELIDLVAHLLNISKMPAGTMPLQSDAGSLMQIKYLGSRPQ